MIKNNAAYISAPSNATVTGPWIAIGGFTNLGFLAKCTGTGNPSGTWFVDVSDDEDTARPVLGPVRLANTAEMTAAAPAGAGVAISAIFPFFNLYGGCPRAKWIRLGLTINSGGSASANQVQVGVNANGIS